MPIPETEPSAERSFPTSLELKELATIFAQERTDEETVLAILDEALLEPIPDLDDESATEEYNAKMAIIRRMVEDQVLVSIRLRSIWERIEAKSAPQVE